MRRALLALALASGVSLAAAGARAVTWTLLDGHWTDAATGRTERLSGSFGGSGFEPDPPDGPLPVVLALDAIDLGADGLALATAGPIEYGGLEPIVYLSLGNAILIEGEQVSWLHARAGGELVAVSEEEVTFRFLELRADASSGSRAIGQLGDSALPRRLELEGTLHEVRQSFGLPGEECASPPPGGGSPGGGGVVIRDGGAILSYDSFDIGASGDVASFQPPTGTGRQLNRVTGEPSSIGGNLQVGGSAHVLNPAGVVFGSSAIPSSSSMLVTGMFGVTPDYVPTLDQLGIRAPDGAEITRDAAGALVVSSAGDLFVEGTLPEIEILYLTSVTLRSATRIVVTGRIALPADVRLNIEAGSIFIEPGSIDPGWIPGPPAPVPAPVPVIVPIFCSGLRPIWPAEERLLGSFSLVATAAQPVAIDVEPGSWRNRIRPGSRQVIPVALFGSRELDVRDVDPRSLRLGAGEAKPLAHRGRPRVLRLHLNRDRRADLLALFSVREAEVAFGDTRLYLVGETEGGSVLEGCDAVEAWPPHRRR